MKAHRLIATALFSGLLLSAGSTYAGEAMCEARKSAVTTSYIDCRLNMIGRAARRDTLPDFAPCDERFTKRWERLEGMGVCSVSGNGPTVRDIAAESAKHLAAMIVGNAWSECGNGVLEPGEECDSEDLDGATCSTLGFDLGALSCSAECSLNTTDCENAPPPVPERFTSVSYKRAFVTSASYLGNLGGIAGADAECNALAASAGLSGEWVAWLSTPEVNAWERIRDAEFRRLDGALIATSLADLTDGTIANPLGITEFGTEISKYVWTGTGPDGNFLAHRGDDCSDWTNGGSDGAAIVGHSQRVDANWTSKTGAACNLGYPNPGLFCFEI